MKRKMYIIPMACMLLLTGCQLGDSISIGNKVEKADNTFIMIKSDEEDGGLSEIYVKYEGIDENKIASDIPINSKLDYLEGKKAILLQDDESSLVMYDSEGDKETIGKDLLGTATSAIAPYKVSENKETIVYRMDDESLYIKEKDKDKDKVANDVWRYEVDSLGKNVYYINDENDLYIYHDGDSEKISSDVTDFKMSANGQTVVFLNDDDDLYMQNIESEDKEKISSGDIKMSSVRIYKDNIITFLNDYDLEDNKGELYVYNGVDKEKVASDVVKYTKKGDKFYFINEEGILYIKSLGADQSNKILSDVQHMVSIQDGVVCINEDGNIYSQQGKKEAVKIGTNIMGKEYLSIVNNQEIVYLTQNNDLFIGGNKIAQEVTNYVYNSEIIAYATKTKEVHSYNLKDKADMVAIDNAKEYSYIYLEDKLLFINLLEPYELEGYWTTTPASFDDECEYNIIAFSGDDKITYYYDNRKYNTTYEVTERSQSAMDLYMKDGNYMEIVKIEDDKISIYDEGNLIDGKKVSKAEAQDIINKKDEKEDNTDQKKDDKPSDDKEDSNTEEDNMYDEEDSNIEDESMYEEDNNEEIEANSDSSYNMDSYSIETEIKTLIEEYEYDYVEAVNMGDPNLVYGHLYYNGKLYNEHSKNIYYFYDEGISETLYEATVKEIEKVNEKEYRVHVYEKIGIIKEGKENVKEFNPTYVVVYDGTNYVIREML